MRRYVVRRLLQIILTMYIFASIVFIIVAAQPGDISRVYVNDPRIPQEAKEALRHRLGLDQPLYMQYVNYMRNLVTGNLGISFTHYPRTVWELIKERLPRTVALFIVATLIYFGLGFQMGKLIAWRRGEVIDYASTVTGVTLWTIYTPWFGLLLLWIFAYKLSWLPLGKFLDPLLWRQYEIPANTVFHYIMIIGGAVFLFLLAVYLLSRLNVFRPRRLILNLGWLNALRPRALTLPQSERRLTVPVPISFFVNLGALALVGVVLWYLLTTTLIGRLALDILWHMILPAFTLVCIGFGGYMLLMRDSMVEVVKEDYVVTAKAKGLPDKVVRDKHAARNALLPMVTSFVLALAFTVDGGIITETIFSWPGMGLTLLTSVIEEDLPLAIGTFTFTGIFALIAHLVADILYAYLDPRIRYE